MFSSRFPMQYSLLYFAKSRVSLVRSDLRMWPSPCGYDLVLVLLSVLAAAKISHFEIMCRVHGSIPTVGTFHRFYCNSLSNGWLSFSKRSGAGTPYCYYKNLDSLKNWNNHFFWIDPFVCPISVPWKYLEVFLSVIGLSWSYVDDDVCPTFTAPEHSEMGLLDFVKSADPFKEKIRERTLVEDFLHNQSDAEFLDRLNVNSAKHACILSELRLRCEYEITVRERVEKKFMKSYETIQQKDAEIVSLKARLQRAEGEATKVIRIRGQVSKLDTTAAVWFKELADLETECQDLHGEIEGEARMREEFMSIQDAEAQRILKWNAKLDVRIAELNYDMDTELYPNMMTTMAGQRWMIGHGLCLAMMKCSLEAGVEHGKVGRSLAELEAYDSRVASEYVSAVNELKNVSFPLLDQLEALKDSPLELLMSSLMLEGGFGDEDPTLEFRSHEILLSDDLAASHACAKKRKNDASLSLAVGRPSAVVLGLAVGSLAPHVSMPSVGPVVPSTSSHETSLVVADYPISSLIIVDDTILATKTHDDLFDTTVLDKPEDHQLY
ncbi:hypothetical protein Tco_0972580 [Tanacetum coccineum]